MEKAIVFGANGYLGRHLVHYLLKNNIDCTPTDIHKESLDGRLNYKQIDITQIEELKTLNYKVNYVFVFAGLTGTGSGEKVERQFRKVNELGLKNILSCLNEKDEIKIVYPSTRLIYKGKKGRLTEGDEKEAKTIYAENKLFCEELIKKSGHAYHIFRICVPYGNLFDATYSYGTIGFFINRAKSGKAISLYGHGEQKRTFTHVSDIINIIIKTIKQTSLVNETFNIGGNDHLSLRELALLIAHKYGVKVNYVDWPPEALKVESGDTLFDDSKIRRHVKFEYEHSIESWINKI